MLYDLCVGLDILVKMGGVNSDHANKYVADILELFLAGANIGNSLFNPCIQATENKQFSVLVPGRAVTAGKCGKGAGSPLGVTRTCGSGSASLLP